MMRAKRKHEKRAGNWRTARTPIGELMAKAGVTQSDIARQLGITSQAVNSALAGRSRNMRVWTAVAAACGVRTEKLLALVKDAVMASALELVADSAKAPAPQK